MVSIKNILIGLAISLVFVFLVSYGTNLFYNQPKYEDFCKSQYYYPEKAVPYTDQRNCTYNPEISSQAEACVEQGADPQYEYDNSGCTSSVKCNFCRQDYEKAYAKYTRTVFIVSGIAGILALAIGALIFSIEAIGAGLMGGGVLSLIYGNIVYWKNLNNLMKVIILSLTLAVLIYIGIRLNKKRSIF